MIDFRYHLISIIAVLLALSVGVVLGSGALGGPLLNNLEQSVQSLRERNRELLDEVSERKSQAEETERFSAEVEPHLVDSTLKGVDVVLIHIEDMGGGALDEMRAAIGEAGGSVSTRITLRSRFAISDDISRDSLALAIGSSSGDPEEIRTQAAQLLGRRLGEAGAAPTGGAEVTPTPAPTPTPDKRAEDFLLDLQDQGFIEIDIEDEEDDGRLVAVDATFVLLAGGGEDPPFDVASFVSPLATSLGGGGAPFVIGETSESSWNVITSVLDASDARDAAATVERVDETSGRVGVILALVEVLNGEIDHYGYGSGATSVLPEPSEDGSVP
ncbi:MAG: copper transporter [Actinobacteria bacterium]|nr:copper transporter [Actinomycetota bacterium]